MQVLCVEFANLLKIKFLFVIAFTDAGAEAAGRSFGKCSHPRTHQDAGLFSYYRTLPLKTATIPSHPRTQAPGRGLFSYYRTLQHKTTTILTHSGWHAPRRGANRHSRHTCRGGSRDISAGGTSSAVEAAAATAHASGRAKQDFADKSSWRPPRDAGSAPRAQAQHQAAALQRGILDSASSGGSPSTRDSAPAGCSLSTRSSTSSDVSLSTRSSLSSGGSPSTRSSPLVQPALLRHAAQLLPPAHLQHATLRLRAAHFRNAPQLPAPAHLRHDLPCSLRQPTFDTLFPASTRDLLPPAAHLRHALPCFRQLTFQTQPCSLRLLPFDTHLTQLPVRESNSVAQLVWGEGIVAEFVAERVSG